MRLLAYITLFEGLAARHQAIQYTSANQRFLHITVSADPIARQLDLSDFHTKLRSKLKAPVGQPFFVLQNYQVDYGDNGGDYRSRQLHGAYYVLQRITPGSMAEHNTALDACEGVAEELLAATQHQLQADYRVHLDLNDCFAEHVGPLSDGHFVGVRMNLSWRESATQDLTYDPTKFLH